MEPRAEEFVERARDRYGVAVDVREFPEGTETAGAAAEAVGCDVSQIASSLVFVADGEPVVVVTSGANRVSEDRLADALGAESVRMAEAGEVREATGWTVGGVPPICHETDLRVMLDETLLDHDTVWAAAGSSEAVWPVAPDRLVELADAEPARVAE